MDMVVGPSMLPIPTDGGFQRYGDIETGYGIEGALRVLGAEKNFFECMHPPALAAVFRV